MGRIKKGILGGFSGKIGNVIGGSWKGIDYMRSIAANRRASKTLKQEIQRAKFALAVSFVYSMKELLELGFKSQAIRMTASNSALAFVLKRAITGTYPALAINYGLVQISRGSLPNAITPDVASANGGTIEFGWVNNSGTGNARSTDKAILVAYCAELNETVYSTTAMRSAATGALHLPRFVNQTVYTWISFMSEDGRDVATSIYTGEAVVV